MPELPEVETVRRGLQKLVLGQKIARVEVLYPKMIVGDADDFRAKLKDQTLENKQTRGKYLLYMFSNYHTIVYNILMEGKFYLK